MIATFESKALLVALRVCNKIAPEKGVPPILQDVALSTHNDRLQVRATDLRRSVSFTIPAQVDEAGDFTTNAALLTELVSNCGNTALRFEHGETMHLLRPASKGKYALNAANVDDYPMMPESDVAACWGGTVPQGTLKRMMRETIYAAAGNAAFSDVLIQFTEDKLRIVATNAARLSVSEYGNAQESFRLGECVTNFQWLQDVAQLMKNESEESEEVVINGDDNRLSFGMDGVMYAIALSGAHFPTYHKNLEVPQDAATLTFNRKDMLDCLARMVPVTSDRQYNRVSFAAAGGLLTMRVACADWGTGSEEIECEQDAAARFDLNGKYLLDFLRSLDAETITARIVRDKRLLLYPLDGPGHYQHVISMLEIKSA